MKKLFAMMLALVMVLAAVPNVALAESTAVYVSSTGEDTNAGTLDQPYATLKKAVEAAEDNAVIYVMSNLSVNESARFWDKHLTITSYIGGPYTVSRGDSFDTVLDQARGTYNPAMVEVQTTDGSASLTLGNIVFDDADKHAGSVFAQAISGEGHGDNTAYVQDAIIASNATQACTITLGEGAILRNFGGMSAVRVTNQAQLVMKNGSIIEDSLSITRTKGNAEAEVGPAGAVWIQGGGFFMEQGAEIKNVNGRAVYVDGGEVTIGGTISGITGNSNMWQGKAGSVIHLRNGAKGTLKGTCVIENVTSDGSAIYLDGASFDMQKAASIKKLTGVMGIYAVNSEDVIINGEITELNGSYAVNLNKTKAILGADGNIHDNTCKTAIVYMRDGSELSVKGRINNNTSNPNDNCAALFIVTNGDPSHATLEDGGEICYNINQGQKYGAAIEVQQGISSFTMNGGKIIGNKGPLGAIQVHKDNASFVMNGGSISNNQNAGIVYNISGKGKTQSFININGGVISENGTQIAINGGAGCDDYERVKLNAGTARNPVTVDTAFGLITLDAGFATTCLGNASDEAAKMIADLAPGYAAGENKHLQAFSNNALYIKPAVGDYHFIMDMPDYAKDKGELYVGYIPLDTEGKPADNAALAVRKLSYSSLLNITLKLDANQPYAVMLLAEQESQKPETFVVTFDSQGGSAVKQQTVEKDGLVTKPADPVREGYDFAGWYSEPGCVNAWDFYADKVEQDITLYAKWGERLQPDPTPIPEPYPEPYYPQEPAPQTNTLPPQTGDMPLWYAVAQFLGLVK